MNPDVYRTSGQPGDEDASARKRAFREELLVPVLALAVGALMLFVSLGQGAPRPTEGGLGTLAVLFGLYSLREAFRAARL